MANGHSDLLIGLAEGEAAALIALGSRLRLPGGRVLFQLGDEADRMFLIERGQVNLTLPMALFGRAEDVLVEERGSGESVGWSALIPPHRFTLKATALVDTEVLSFPRASLLPFFSERPDLGQKVMRNVAAVIGQRLKVFQAMWLREMTRVVELSQA